MQDGPLIYTPLQRSLRPAARPQMCRPLGKVKGKRASAQTEAEPSRLPYRAIAALSLCNAAHFYSLCSIFSKP